MRLGQVIRAWREAQGLGMREASKLIGVPLATLGRLERGKPTESATLARVLNFLMEPV
jgi:transcriptional regulator with XRE-family HTH domain